MNNYGVVEFASTARHDGYGNMVEIFVISSVNASVTLVRKGVMRASGLDTKMRDVRRSSIRSADHYERAMAQAEKMLQDLGHDYTGTFDDDPTSPGYFLREPLSHNLNDPVKGALMEAAVKYLFNDAIWYGMMWDLFPDMEKDPDFIDMMIEEADSAEVLLKEKAQQYAAWGAF